MHKLGASKWTGWIYGTFYPWNIVNRIVASACLPPYGACYSFWIYFGWMASFRVERVLLWESASMVSRDLKNRVLRCGIWWSPPLDNVGRYYCVDKSVGLLVLFICRSVILLWVDLLKIEFWDCNKFNCRIILSVQESRNESQVAASDTIPRDN